MKHLDELSCEEQSTLLPCCDMPLPNNSPTIFVIFYKHERNTYVKSIVCLSVCPYTCIS